MKLVLPRFVTLKYSPEIGLNLKEYYDNFKNPHGEEIQKLENSMKNFRKTAEFYPENLPKVLFLNVTLLLR
jgi:hypothetical protein